MIFSLYKAVILVYTYSRPLNQFGMKICCKRKPKRPLNQLWNEILGDSVQKRIQTQFRSIKTPEAGWDMNPVCPRGAMV